MADPGREVRTHTKLPGTMHSGMITQDTCLRGAWRNGAPGHTSAATFQLIGILASSGVIHFVQQVRQVPP
jgi:hypothetical protein